MNNEILQRHVKNQSDLINAHSIDYQLDKGSSSLVRNPSKARVIQLPSINSQVINKLEQNQKSRSRLHQNNSVGQTPQYNNINSLKHYYEVLDKQRKKSIEKINNDLKLIYKKQNINQVNQKELIQQYYNAVGHIGRNQNLDIKGENYKSKMRNQSQDKINIIDISKIGLAQKKLSIS